MVAISKTRQYKILQGMKQRCYNPKSPIFRWYGAKGVTVCAEWLGKDGARRFYDWSVSHGYDDTRTIDRIDSNKEYSPANCVWEKAGCNIPNVAMAPKLCRIIREFPTFELEYARQHIADIDDPQLKRIAIELCNEREAGNKESPDT